MTQTETALDPQARERIVRALARVEQEHDVRVLYACESGSRAWGFPSPDSDYDARFIYVHRPDWYFSVFERRDVIELPISGDEDINGWDLRKALRLLARSNPVLMEWLQSPLIYRRDEPFHQELLALARQAFVPKAGHWHYYHMARKNFREHLLDEQVKLKKYFYVLRPVLACLWIEQGLGLPPMQFMALLERMVPPGSLRDSIAKLHALKLATSELGAGPRIPAIHEYLDQQLARLALLDPQVPTRTPVPGLDEFLRQWAGADIS